MTGEKTPTDADEPHADGEAARIEWNDARPPSTAVVEAVAAATDSDPLDLPTLHESLDADALDALVRSGDPSRGDVYVSFSYGGCEVTVEGGGTVVATRADDAAA